MRFVAIDEYRDKYRLKSMCKALRVSISGYHAWRKRPISERKIEECRLVGIIENVHEKSRESYGSPRIHAVLNKMEDVDCSLSRTARLMRKHGIKARSKRKFKATTNSKHKLPVAENILNREFNPENPNKAWAGDITYIWTNEGWLYLAVVLDLFSRKIVGWAMDETMSRELVLKALRMAIQTRQPDKGLITHTDRGSQYASEDYQKLLKLYHAVCSMSRKGNCWDNAVVESFFGTLKQEHIFFEKFETRDEAKRSVFEWIEGWYNIERIHSSLGNVSPAEYEMKSEVA